MLPKDVTPELVTTDNNHDQKNSTVVEQEAQVVIPAEISPEEIERMPNESSDVINCVDSESVIKTSNEIKLSPAGRPMRSRQKPARFRD